METQNGPKPPQEKDPLYEKTLFVDLSLRENVLKLGDRIVIDARPGVDPRLPKRWVSPKAYRQMGDVWNAVRSAYENDTDMNQALKEAGEQLGITGFEQTRVIGTPPEHWKKKR